MNIVRKGMLFLFFVTCTHLHAKEGITPVAKHGALAINQGQLVNQHGQQVSFAGPSFFWSNNGWGGDAFYSESVVESIVNHWNAGIIRAAMGVDGHGGYLEHPEDNLKKAEALIDAAIKNDVYVVVDFHSHHAHDVTDKAVAFFEHIARRYGQYPNVLYEIYNEPLNTADWAKDVKPYSEKVITAIRAIDPDNVILVGTTSWAQDVDEAARNPITGFNNLAYTLHFYAGTHKQSLRDKAQVAIDAGLALFVSEWGTVNANGDGDIDRESTKAWLEFIRKHQLSHLGWSLNSKKEGASFLTPDAPVDGNWREHHLTENGKFLREIIKGWGY